MGVKADALKRMLVDIKRCIVSGEYCSGRRTLSCKATMQSEIVVILASLLAASQFLLAVEGKLTNTLISFSEICQNKRWRWGQKFPGFIQYLLVV